ncbi:MAG TPA: ion transporter [Halieaceae bacterium]|jgi:voltage-gated sodium channel|uniref:ion transporter n=1 Tax=Haliea sp. TaxID=1932666 RepID=UPI000C523BF7|nr:ion transporter [Haliea sp.]HBQ39975.1 ion transporter [Halieaceae bacterium]MAD63885.1 ion transporter [Haliea sp.]MAY92246.1 ion transporter [Haliea sp.]MBK42170.1 ion transporter [Haliea sp.]MBP71231.1 ion transporter [Haliea sp.]|tara:strand:- start:702 stop:1559 length:858 start_codon:yes stop_codon:yes gene_type:complete
MSSASLSSTGSGLLRRIESSRLFQGAVIAIILLSALTIGAKTYDLPPLAERSLGFLDTAITLFFLLEILFRFAACPDKRRFFRDGWNIFDTLVVIGSLIPLDNSQAVLLGRLLRVFRVLRLVSVVPELRFLINSLLKAIPRMGYIALLMFIIFYIYAAVGSMLFAEVDETLWGDVAIAMLTLFRVATFEDWTDVMYATMEAYPLSWFYYLTFIFLTAFIFLNMMVGAVLGVMTAEQNAREAQQAHDERDLIAQQLDDVQKQLRLLTAAVEQDRGAASPEKGPLRG